MSELEDRINAVLGNPAEMERISALAAKLMGGGEDKGAPAPPENGLDVAAVSKISGIMAKLREGDKDHTALLRAMQPYLAQERREKLEKALRFAKIAKIAGTALREYGGGDGV